MRILAGALLALVLVACGPGPSAVTVRPPAPHPLPAAQGPPTRVSLTDALDLHPLGRWLDGLRWNAAGARVLAWDAARARASRPPWHPHVAAAAPHPSAPPIAPGGRTILGVWVDVRRMLRLHHCEQSDTWYANGYFGNGLHGGGGLGMSDDAWRMARRAANRRGLSLPEFSWITSPDLQMLGATLFWQDYGWGWSCRV